MPVKSKLGMKVTAAPSGNVEPEGMIARERKKAVVRGNEITGEHAERGQRRIPRVAPSTIVSPSKRRRLV